MNNYNPEKIKKFHEYIIQDYETSLIVDRIVNVLSVEKTDGTFTQIGIRPLIDEDILIDPGFSEYLPGAGRMVAVGEEEFLIKNILENKEIENIDLDDDIKEFPKYAYEIENSLILLSTKFYTKFFTKLMSRIDYEQKTPRLDKQYKIISIPERILGNKIVILNKDSIRWKKQTFIDKETNKKTSISINHKSSEQFGKLDVTIRSVNKIESIDSNLIKIFEVKNGEKS